MGWVILSKNPRQLARLAKQDSVAKARLSLQERKEGYYSCWEKTPNKQTVILPRDVEDWGHADVWSLPVVEHLQRKESFKTIRQTKVVSDLFSSLQGWYHDLSSDIYLTDVSRERRQQLPRTNNLETMQNRSICSTNLFGRTLRRSINAPE